MARNSQKYSWGFSRGVHLVYKTKADGRQPGRLSPGNPAIAFGGDLLPKIPVDNPNGVAYSIIQQSETRRFAVATTNDSTTNAFASKLNDIESWRCNNMAIVNSDTINKWERELIESLAAALDVDQVRSLFADQYGVNLKENLESDQGRIVAFNNQIVYELRFKTTAVIPVVIDRSGNFQGFGRTNEKDAMHNDRPGPGTMLSDPEVIRRKERELISAVASDLNINGVGTLIAKEFKLQVRGDPQFQSGDFVVFKGRAGIQLDFAMAINFSILVDRNGHYMHFGDFTPGRIPAEKVAGIESLGSGPDNGSNQNMNDDPGN
jgi:hypothetical protein